MDENYYGNQGDGQENSKPIHNSVNDFAMWGDETGEPVKNAFDRSGNEEPDGAYGQNYGQPYQDNANYGQPYQDNTNYGQPYQDNANYGQPYQNNANYGQPYPQYSQPDYGQGYNQGYGYGQPYGSGAPQKDRSGLAIAAMVVGIVGIVLCWIPILPIVVSVLALIFGILSRRSARRGMAIAGIVLGAVGIVIGICYTIYFFAVMEAVEEVLPYYYGDDYSDIFRQFMN